MASNKRKFEELFRFLSGRESKPDRAISVDADRWELHPSSGTSTTTPEAKVSPKREDTKAAIKVLGQRKDVAALPSKYMGKGEGNGETDQSTALLMADAINLQETRNQSLILRNQEELTRKETSVPKEDTVMEMEDAMSQQDRDDRESSQATVDGMPELLPPIKPDPQGRPSFRVSPMYKARDGSADNPISLDDDSEEESVTTPAITTTATTPIAWSPREEHPELPAKRRKPGRPRGSKKVRKESHHVPPYQPPVTHPETSASNPPTSANEPQVDWLNPEARKRLERHRLQLKRKEEEAKLEAEHLAEQERLEAPLRQERARIEALRLQEHVRLRAQLLQQQEKEREKERSESHRHRLEQKGKERHTAESQRQKLADERATQEAKRREEEEKVKRNGQAPSTSSTPTTLVTPSMQTPQPELLRSAAEELLKRQRQFQKQLQQLTAHRPHHHLRTSSASSIATITLTSQSAQMNSLYPTPRRHSDSQNHQHYNLIQAQTMPNPSNTVALTTSASQTPSRTMLLAHNLMQAQRQQQQQTLMRAQTSPKMQNPITPTSSTTPAPQTSHIELLKANTVHRKLLEYQRARQLQKQESFILAAQQQKSSHDAHMFAAQTTEHQRLVEQSALRNTQRLEEQRRVQMELQKAHERKIAEHAEREAKGEKRDNPLADHPDFPEDIPEYPSFAPPIYPTAPALNFSNLDAAHQVRSQNGYSAQQLQQQQHQQRYSNQPVYPNYSNPMAMHGSLYPSYPNMNNTARMIRSRIPQGLEILQQRPQGQVGQNMNEDQQTTSQAQAQAHRGSYGAASPRR